MYDRADWRNAMDANDTDGWDEITIREEGGPLRVALFEAYENDIVEQDTAILEAALVAAASQYGSEWDVSQFEALWPKFVGTVDGWQGVAEDYLDDHYPGLVTTHGKHMDLEEIGREYARDRQSEHYVTIPDDTRVFMFNKR